MLRVSTQLFREYWHARQLDSGSHVPQACRLRVSGGETCRRSVPSWLSLVSLSRSLQVDIIAEKVSLLVVALGVDRFSSSIREYLF